MIGVHFKLAHSLPNISLLASRIRPRFTSVVSGYAPVLAWALRSPLASRAPTGESSLPLTHGEQIVDVVTIGGQIRYLIWIGTVYSSRRCISCCGSDCIRSSCHIAVRANGFTGSDQEKTFGPTISGLIHRHIGPERLLLWDSKVRGGRPDTMKILKEVYREWNAEGRIP